jgi:uncharacterized membrane protein
LFPAPVNLPGTHPATALEQPGMKLATPAGSIHRQEVIVERIEKSVDVDCPIRTVYNQWTQFEDFPRFMAGVKEVKQLDDTHVHWHAEIWGKDEEWDAEITEQKPEERISWKSVSGAYSAGTVRFEPIGPERTRVRLVMAYDPQGVVANVGDALGIFSGRVQNTVEDFKKFIEKRRQETGGWRGEVHDSKPQVQGGPAGGKAPF